MHGRRLEDHWTITGGRLDNHWRKQQQRMGTGFTGAHGLEVCRPGDVIIFKRTEPVAINNHLKGDGLKFTE